MKTLNTILNNKRWIIILNLIIILSVTFSYMLFNSYALTEPISSVNIVSENLDYENQEPGSYKITKSAKWIDENKAQVTIELDTILKKQNESNDVILVVDTSTNVKKPNLDAIKSQLIEYTEQFLSNPNNNLALINFTGVAYIQSDFTNDKEVIIEKINSLSTSGQSSYYRPLVEIDTLLSDYQKSADRDCIVHFISATIPNTHTPNEISQYQYLKQVYPFINIIGIQFQNGDTVFPQLQKITDEYFAITSDNELLELLLNTSSIPITYNNFTLTDSLDTQYFSIVDTRATTGELIVEPSKIIWNLLELKSGRDENLTVTLELKEEYRDQAEMYPINQILNITSTIQGVNENISSTLTPVLSSHYQVMYDPNLPDDCALAGTIPQTESIKVFKKVEISDDNLICEGYQFQGWRVVEKNVVHIGSSSFIMPESDVTIRAVWSKIGIVKSMNGEVQVYQDDVLQRVTYEYDDEIWAYKDSITKIVFQNSLNEITTASESFDISENKNGGVMAYLVTNSDATTYTAYIQGNGQVKANPDSSNLFNKFINLTSIEGLEYLDTSNVENMNAMFHRCYNLSSFDIMALDTSNVTTMRLMFAYCRALTSLDLSNFDTSKVTDMYAFVYDCTGLTSLDVSNFITTDVLNMDSMFYNCIALTTLNLSSFVTPKVTNMSNMFYNCNALKSLNISNFDTTNVENMTSMFYYCNNLTNLNLSNFNTPNLTTVRGMFYNCRGLTSLNVSSFDTSDVTDMGLMFANCSSLKSLDVTNFDTSKVTGMQALFYGCSTLTSLDVSNFDTTNVTAMNRMFYQCSSITSLNLSNFNTDKVTTMNTMFFKCQALTNLTVSSFNTSNVTDMISMFYGCISLTSLSLSNFNTAKVTDMSTMFYNCESLTSLNVSNFDVSSVLNMNNMFSYCSSLTQLNLSSFVPSNATNMEKLFQECNSLVSLNISNFDTSSATTMYRMFYNCTSLTSLKVSSFDTSNVLNMDSMFFGCESLTSLKLSNFDTSATTSMYAMFYNCNNLTTLDVSSFDTSNVLDMNRMFFGCESLTSLNLSNFITTKVTDMGYMFNACISLTSINLSNAYTNQVTNTEHMFAYCYELATLDIRTAVFTKVTSYSEMFADVLTTIKVTVRNTTAQTFIQNRLGSGIGTVTIA